jgi:hypothetical protein
VRLVDTNLFGAVMLATINTIATILVLP